MDSRAMYSGLGNYGYNLILINLQAYRLKTSIHLLSDHSLSNWDVVLLLVMRMLLGLRFLASGMIAQSINMRLVRNFQEIFSLKSYHMICIPLFYRTIVPVFLIQKKR